MSDKSASVPTLLRGRFRRAEGRRPLGPFAGAPGRAADGVREELFANSRLPDTLLRFLIDMDRKLDAILAHLQEESLAGEFPGEGQIVELSGNCLVLECAEPFAPGETLELLLLLEEFPLRVVPVLATVDEKRATPALTGPAASVYALTYLSVEEEDREAIIRHVFSEERKRIRQRKEDGA
jgi:hypothetical protein